LLLTTATAGKVDNPHERIVRIMFSIY